VPYRIELTTAARRQLRSLPAREQTRVGQTIDELATDPRPPGSQKLAGLENQWRVRVGDYRIIYEVRDRVLLVLVIRIGHRRDIYRR